MLDRMGRIPGTRGTIRPSAVLLLVLQSLPPLRQRVCVRRRRSRLSGALRPERAEVNDASLASIVNGAVAARQLWRGRRGNIHLSLHVHTELACSANDNMAEAWFGRRDR